MAKRKGEVTISGELFQALVDYHIAGNVTRSSAENEKIIVREIEKKAENVAIRQAYNAWKFEKNAKKREELKKIWLDKKGIPEDFRY